MKTKTKCNNKIKRQIRIALTKHDNIVSLNDTNGLREGELHTGFLLVGGRQHRAGALINNTEKGHLSQTHT